MQLRLVHQILIGSAIGLAVLFGVRSAVLFARDGGSDDFVLAVASVVVAALLAIYLRKVRAKWRSAGPPGGSRAG